MADLNVLYNVLVQVGGWRAGKFVTAITNPIERQEVDVSALEDAVDQAAKGTARQAFTLQTMLSNVHSLTRMDELVANDHLIPAMIGLQRGTVAGTPCGLFPRAGIYNLGPQVARNTPYNATLQLRANDMMAYGQWIYSALGSAGVGAGAPAGAAFELGALGAGQRLVAIQAVLDDPAPEGTGTELVGTIESDAAGAFSTPITRITFDTGVLSGLGAGEFLMPGAVYELLDGDATPITDTFWRYVPAVTGSATPLVWPLVGLAIVNKEVE